MDDDDQVEVLNNLSRHRVYRWQADPNGDRVIIELATGLQYAVEGDVELMDSGTLLIADVSRRTFALSSSAYTEVHMEKGGMAFTAARNQEAAETEANRLRLEGGR